MSAPFVSLSENSLTFGTPGRMAKVSNWSILEAGIIEMVIGQ